MTVMEHLLTGERSVEVTCDCRYYDDGCAVCEKFDELTCSRGRRCCSISDDGAVIGQYLDEDPETGYDVGRSTLVFAFPSSAAMFCEDCIVEIENTPDDDREEWIVLEGRSHEVHWYVEVQQGEFYAWMATFDRTGGMSYERVLGSRPTLGAATHLAAFSACLTSMTGVDPTNLRGEDE